MGSFSKPIFSSRDLAFKVLPLFPLFSSLVLVFIFSFSHRFLLESAILILFVFLFLLGF